MFYKDNLNKKIPELKPLNLYKEYNFIDSAFVEIPDIVKISGKIKIVVDLQYPKMGMKNAINKCLIRKEALDRLLSACNLLPDNLAFKILDIYRTWELQNELYYVYKPSIIKKFNLENLSKEEQNKIISNFVSIPNKDEIIPPPHTTGGAIDLTITDLISKKDLDFGIGFDDFSDLTNSDYFEKINSNITIRNNRRLLYNLMTKSGFTNLPSEIWHYDYGNRAWGYYKNIPAFFKGYLDINDINSIILFDQYMKEKDMIQ